MRPKRTRRQAAEEEDAAGEDAAEEDASEEERDEEEQPGPSHSPTPAPAQVEVPDAELTPSPQISGQIAAAGEVEEVEETVAVSLGQEGNYVHKA